MAELTPEEVVESFVFPIKLTKKQQKGATKQLKAAREKTRAAMTEETKLSLSLLRLKFLLEAYKSGGKYDEKPSFGYLLKEYITLLRKSRKVFPDGISINQSEKGTT